MIKAIIFITLGLIILSLWHIRQYKTNTETLQNNIVSQISSSNITENITTFFTNIIKNSISEIIQKK